MSSENWDEIRTAYQVVRQGTVSGAASVMGVHHATVIRHIDALEARLGVKLFQRHARGYTPTEAGQDLMQVAAVTEDQFAQLFARMHGRKDIVSGDLVVTTIPVANPLLICVMTRFREAYPGVTLHVLSEDRILRLEYGEAHIAVRAGDMPKEPDNVVQPLISVRFALCAAPRYLEKSGLPGSVSDLAEHVFVGHERPDHPAPTEAWLRAHVDRSQVKVRMNQISAMEEAVLDGAGIGFVSEMTLRAHPKLVQVLPPQEDWATNLWIVTHVDLHRTPKVQAFLRLLKEEVVSWRNSQQG